MGDCPILRAACGVHLSEIHSRKKNVVTDQLSLPNQALLTEWSLLPWVFGAICEVYDYRHMDVFPTRTIAKLPLYVSPVPVPIAWKLETFQHLWDDLGVFTFPRC